MLVEEQRHEELLGVVLADMVCMFDAKGTLCARGLHYDCIIHKRVACPPFDLQSHAPEHLQAQLQPSDFLVEHEPTRLLAQQQSALVLEAPLSCGHNLQLRLLLRLRPAQRLNPMQHRC